MNRHQQQNATLTVLSQKEATALWNQGKMFIPFQMFLIKLYESYFMDL